MTNARLSRLAAVAVALTLLATPAARSLGAARRDGPAVAGVEISNRAEASYTDPQGLPHTTVSETVVVTVRTVAAVTVTPDETESSANVSPNDRVVRLFRVCNTGNTPDFYSITSAEVSAPAAFVSAHFDSDGDGRLTDADRAITLGQTLSPRLTRGECTGVLVSLDTNQGQTGQLIQIRITAQSSVRDAANIGASDVGTIINTLGDGPKISSPSDPQLPPVKLVGGRASVTTSPGQPLDYLVHFRNSGDTPARSVVVSDDLPAGLEYVAGSLRLNDRALTDAEDADEGKAQDNRLRVLIAELAVGEEVRVAFQARVTAGVAHGTGLVNTAVVTPANAPAASSTTATAVVNPFGLVFQGRSPGTPIPGALVSLLTDPSSGSPLALAPDAGSAPNEPNANPFNSDGQGRWSFVLSPQQIGTSQAPARYFLNVTAAGYRSRLIEVTVTPSPEGANLFTLAVRALDGQPVARAGGFELTEQAVEITRLAAFAMNVPMFESTTIELTKTADRPSVEVGDVVSYRVEIRNATPVAVDDLVVRDQLPPSFHYAPNTARLEAPPEAPRSVEPESRAAGLLVFRVGRVQAGSRAVLTYRVRVGANVREGDQFNAASATGVLTTGEQVSTPTARAAVRVRRGIFSSQQVIIGRVFDDANGDSQFDRDEKGVPGVRIYLNNGQSVVTDSEGLYNFPVVNEGAQVLSLDPVTLPPGYALADTGRREDKSWSRLLRTPLGGGALLRQNFALRSHDADAASSVASAGNALAPQDGARKPILAGNLFGGPTTTASPRSAEPKTPPPAAPGTYEVAATETLEPVAPGEVRVLSPQPGETVSGAALEVRARVAAGWAVEVEVEGQRVPDTKIAERRVDQKNNVATFTFVGVGLKPGPNRVRVTAVGPDGARGATAELTAYGRGPAKRIEIVPDRTEVSTGGRDSTTVRVRAFDQWGHPAADGTVALEVSTGRLMRLDDGKAVKPSSPADAAGKLEEQAASGQQIITLTGGEASVLFVGEGAPGNAEIRATTGAVEAKQTLRVTPEVRPAILVGLAELTVGAGGPELSTGETAAGIRSRLAFFYRGRLDFMGTNLLTLAYDSNRPINRTAGHDRLFQFDPLDRAYPLFGDSSTRFEDAPSNSKLYFRLDRGRSYFMFGDIEPEGGSVGLASYTRKLTGAKLHVENSSGDYVSVTGARPDTAYARDVFAGGALGFARLSHTEILPGSESVTIEVRDRRNPEIILSRETLVRSVDYNLDATLGEIFFLRPVSTFDFNFNLVQVVVAYEHRASGMSSAVYTGRAFKTFDRLGLKVGLSFVDQRQGEMGAFRMGGVDAEKRMPRGGRLKLEWATSRGRVAVGGNVFTTEGADDRHDGNAYRVELEQPLPYREMMLRASFARADEGFINPFGATVTPGSQRADASVEMRARKSSRVRLSLTDERNKTSNVDNSRQTASLLWTESFTDRLRVMAGFDFRRFRDETNDKQTDSNLLTVGAEWQATDKLQLSAKREQNLGEADPSYPDQTTLAATYQWNQYTRLFFTQRLASAPIVPISDSALTGFASTGARRETAIGVETRLGRYANLVSRYQLENGIDGTDSFAVIGLANRLSVTKQLALDLGYERGFHLAGKGESFNAAHLGFSWQPYEDFRTTARYEMRDRGGLGSVFTLGAQGRLGDNWTSMARYQLSRTNFGGRDGQATSMTGALAWRPLRSDAAGLLFSYTRRDLTQEGSGITGGRLRDRSDLLSSDGYYQATRNLELYGRFALKFGDTSSPQLAPASTLTYLTQGRAAYRLGQFIDIAGEGRWLAQPASMTRRASFGTELGFWVLPDLRLGAGYNWAGAYEPFGTSLQPGRRGFYFTISSKLSNLFDLFGTS
ncbi:MAG TPA: hypothetical protein VD968_00225, partial [Pyrinomonadaceae bacterium]|nr:hypothetical protein [Pyrinomonadaceae bacterium]